MNKKNTSKILISVFLVYISLISFLYLFLPKHEFSSMEKRVLAQFPKVTFERIKDGTFTKDFEKFLADQTPLRSFYVSVNSYYELFKGNNGSNGIYLGKDGWLIEKPVPRINNFEKNKQKINNFASKQNIPVYLCIVPSKGYIYGQYLPNNALEYYDNNYISSLSDPSSDYLLINLVSVLSKQSSSIQMFYKTDHHWTTNGAYLAYNEICNSLNLKALPKSDFKIRIADTNFYGTSYSKSCYTLTKPDSIVLYENDIINNSTVTVVDGSSSTEYSGMIFEEAFDTDDKYVCFLNGNHGYERIETGAEGGTLLLIKDSFAHCIVPFLAQNYSTIIMIDLRYYKNPVSKIISSENITDILFLYGIDTFATSNDIILK